MASILLSGPAGAAKSQVARQLLAEHPGLAVAADFQAIVAALLLLERGQDGKYPVRPEWVLPLGRVHTPGGSITGARAREVDVIATNSDGSPERRRFLLQQPGRSGASERVIDPGRKRWLRPGWQMPATGAV